VKSGWSRWLSATNVCILAFFDLVKNSNLNDLAHQKCHEAANDDTHVLTENSTECILNIFHPLPAAAAQPRISGRYAYCEIIHQKRIGNQHNCSDGNSSYCFGTKKFIDDICEHKFQWPK